MTQEILLLFYAGITGFVVGGWTVWLLSSPSGDSGFWKKAAHRAVDQAERALEGWQEISDLRKKLSFQLQKEVVYRQKLEKYIIRHIFNKKI